MKNSIEFLKISLFSELPNYVTAKMSFRKILSKNFLNGRLSVGFLAFRELLSELFI